MKYINVKVMAKKRDLLQKDPALGIIKMSELSYSDRTIFENLPLLYFLVPCHFFKQGTLKRKEKQTKKLSCCSNNIHVQLSVEIIALNYSVRLTGLKGLKSIVCISNFLEIYSPGNNYIYCLPT